MLVLEPPRVLVLAQVLFAGALTGPVRLGPLLGPVGPLSFFLRVRYGWFRASDRDGSFPLFWLQPPRSFPLFSPLSLSGAGCSCPFPLDIARCAALRMCAGCVPETPLSYVCGWGSS